VLREQTRRWRNSALLNSITDGHSVGVTAQLRLLLLSPDDFHMASQRTRARTSSLTADHDTPATARIPSGNFLQGRQRRRVDKTEGWRWAMRGPAPTDACKASISTGSIALMVNCERILC
jgi:hypothetical protein